MSHPALADWTGLSLADRSRQAALCQAVAADLDEAFDLFVERPGHRPSAASTGDLQGMPYAAKDMFDLPGRAPLFGLESPLRAPGTAPAEMLRRLDAAGAVRIGITRMTGIAYEPSGVGTARNPWGLAMAPGGSSSGSAAAVACGAVFVALGSDTGGSLRIPAHCCGVTAWKPSPGTVPGEGAMALSPSLDTIGLIARSARDIALTMTATGLAPAGEDGGEPPDIAVAADLLAEAAPSVRAACEDGIAHLGRLGCRLDEHVALPEVRKAGDAALRVMQAEAAREFASWLDAPSGDPLLRRRLESGRGIDDATLAEDLAGRASARSAFLAAVFGGCDYLALPVMAIRTPALSEVDPASRHFTPRLLYALSAWTRFANYLGLPALSLPTGFDDRGMPVGLQLVGRPASDRRLVELGAAFQRTSSWHRRMPPFARPVLRRAESLVA